MTRKMPKPENILTIEIDCTTGQWVITPPAWFDLDAMARLSPLVGSIEAVVMSGSVPAKPGN